VTGVSLHRTARELFDPIAQSYERWAQVLSLGQDGRWRRTMVEGLDLKPGGRALDVAAGTGSITRLLEQHGQRVTALDLSPAMLSEHPGSQRVRALAETLPFGEGTFDSVTSGYLLRYVSDPMSCLRELGRVVRSGGMVGMVEFGMPAGVWRRGWQFYAGRLLPLAGRLIDPGWYRVGRFLGGSIEEFHQRHLDPAAMWSQAGFVNVRVRTMTLGSGLIVWGRKP
jgi:demethylmenaquinone methyltransferase/2-methoxy-6-polyprenyl-1,4-benzoquinol methylase